MLWSAPSPSLCLSWHTDTLFDQSSPCSSREHLKRAQHYMSMVLLRGRAQEEAGVRGRVGGFRHHLLLYSLEGPSWILCKDSMRRVSPSPPDSSGCSCCLCLAEGFSAYLETAHAAASLLLLTRPHVTYTVICDGAQLCVEDLSDQCMKCLFHFQRWLPLSLESQCACLQYLLVTV